MLSNVAAHNELKDHHDFSNYLVEMEMMSMNMSMPQVDDAIGEMLALQYEELLDSQAVLERRLQATVDGMADGQRQAAALVAEAAAKAEELALAQEILRVRQDWREPRGVIRPARSR